MKKNQFMFPVLVLAAATLAHAQGAAPTKIGIIHVQAAILGTKDGKKAGDELNGRFGLRKTELDKKQVAIDQLKDQLQKGSATMSDDAKNKLVRQIDGDTTKLKRDTEDAQAEMEQEEGKIFNELGSKLYAIVEKYAKDNGYTMIIDVSGQQQPVWWASDSINITNEVVALYDKATAGGATSAAPAPRAPAAGTPAGPPVRTPAPAGAPPAAPKKQ